MFAQRLRNELTLIATSVFIALVLWLIAKQGGLERDWVVTPVDLIEVSPNMIVEAQPPAVSIKVQYPPGLSNRIVAKNFSIAVRADAFFDNDPDQWVAPAESQRAEMTLKTSMVRTHNLPRNVQITGFEPRRVALRARFRSQAFKVRVNLVGQLPPGLELISSPRPHPDEVILTGSAEALRQLAESGNGISTSEVDLGQIDESGQVYPELVLPDAMALLEPSEPRVTLDIGVSEKPVQQTLSRIPIDFLLFSEDLEATLEPLTADVVIEGPPSALAHVGAGDLVLSPAAELVEEAGARQEVGLVARLSSRVAPEIAQRIRVLECIPPRVSVEFTRLRERGASSSTESSTGTP